MEDLVLLNSKFESIGKLESKISLSADSISIPIVHQVVKAHLANKRQGTACTKNKSIVRGGGKKPFKQKGTGRARQGSSRSPLMPGGGVVFGPTPRDYSQKVNKKIAKRAIHSILADKYQAGKLTLIEKFESNGKTKEIYSILNEKGMLPALVVLSEKNSLAFRAIRNIENAKSVSAESFNVYEAVRFENLILEKDAFIKILDRLG